MADRTQRHPGAWSQQIYGDFSGKPPYVPPTAPITERHPGGWSQMLYGDFSGKPPFVPPPPTEGAKIPVRLMRLGTFMTRG